MTIRSSTIPAGFTLLYLVVAFVVGPAMDQSSWVRLGRSVALGLAATSAIVLWVLYGAFWSRGAPRSQGALLLTGILCPIVVATATFQVASLTRRLHERTTARQLAHSRISKLADEPLLGGAGNPIGVRIRYSVAYADGLDDLHHAPFATVHVNAPVVNLLTLKTEVSPPVRGGYGRSEYRFTEDHVPSFLPAGFIFPESKDSCFRWSNEAQRAAVLRSAAQRYEIMIEPHRHRSETANGYALRTFYEGALRGGGKECR
jgi:hypothetical protein